MDTHHEKPGDAGAGTGAGAGEEEGPEGWPAFFEPVRAADPALAAAFRRYRAAGWTLGPLDAKTKELILLAVNASATHLHLPAMRFHMERACRAGATPDEILEILELTSVIGIHTCTMGLPVLFEELAAAGLEVPGTLDPRQEAIKARFVEGRGWWSDFLEQMLILAPELLAAYVDYSTVPWKRGAIAPKIKELVYIAIDSQTTHLYETGTRSHIRNALKLGATAAEITQVFALISGLGFHTMTVGVPLLADTVQADSRPEASS